MLLQETTLQKLKDQDKSQEAEFEDRLRMAQEKVNMAVLQNELKDKQIQLEDQEMKRQRQADELKVVKLANETLYNLAEVYGVEQRFMDQLQLLRAVGRLGQTSKRWHEPGVALSIVVQDSDLGISRGHTSIPVNIRTAPGGDAEQVNLISGGAGKGLFMAEVPTALGVVTKNDRVLQLKGGDVITVDYPEAFKKEFRFHMMGTNEINVASDANFDPGH